jgi:hypothetical protein
LVAPTLDAQERDHPMKIPDKYLRAIPIDLRAYIQPCLYGLVGGSAAVAFQLGIKLLEWALWTRLAHLAAGYFVLISLGTILATSLVAGLILTFVSREAAGSGPHATIREAISKMIDKSVSLLVVISPTDETPIGIVTLHDIVRLQSQLAEAI